MLFVKPKEEGEHLLSVTVNGEHVPNSPFLIPVNNHDYYRSTLKQPAVQTMAVLSPRQIAFSSNGDMFVTSTSTHSIHVYDKHGQKKKEIGKPGKGDLEFNHPHGIAITAKMVFVSDKENHRIQKFFTNGKFMSKFGSYGSGDGHLQLPQGLTIGPDGMIYVSDCDNNRIAIFCVDGVFVHNIDVSGSVTSPQGLALSADGYIHVTGFWSGNYAVFSLAGKLVRSHEFHNATDVAVDAAGIAFAVSYTNENNSLSIFGTQGEVVNSIKLDRPRGVAIAPDGSVWVVGFSHNKLGKF